MSPEADYRAMWCVVVVLWVLIGLFVLCGCELKLHVESAPSVACAASQPGV